MGLLHGAADSFNRLLQSTAADQAAPGPALPLSPQAAPAGDRPSGERDPIVRTRPERYGRAIAPDELPGQEAPPPVPVKAHVRSAPGTAAAAPAPEKPPVTLDAIVDQYRRTLRYTTRRHIYMGGLVDSWVRKQPERQEQLPRAAAMIVIEQRFATERLDAAECRPHRDLKCYHAARLLGGDGESVVWSALRHVLKLVERRDYDHWQLRPASADSARALWARMLAGGMTADQVKAEVDRILPPKAARSSKASWSRQAATVLKIVPHLSAEELVAVRLEVQRLLKQAKSAPPQLAAG